MITLNGFLVHNAIKIRDSQGQTLNPMFATPRTLFCDGMNIDDIEETGVISEEDNSDLFFAVAMQVGIVGVKSKQSSRGGNFHGYGLDRFINDFLLSKTRDG